MADQKISQLNPLLAAGVAETDLFVVVKDPSGTPETMKMTVAETRKLFANTDYVDFGDGRDGDVTISGTTTLTRDMYYNNLTVNATLNTDGFRIYVAGTLSGTGSINHNGSNGGVGGDGIGGGAYGAGGTGAPSTGAGVFKTGAGGNGGAGNTPNGNVGSAAANINWLPLSALAAAGGNGSSGSGSGGAGGPVNTIAELNRIAPVPVTHFGIGVTTAGLIEFLKKSGGSGGGGGGRNTGFANERSAGGGGGGASGGVVWIAARNFNGSFTINCNGGNGGNGGTGSGGSTYGMGGGGAGGHGGFAVVFYETKAWTGAFSATGGTGGVTAGALADGANGTAGSMLEIEVVA